MPIDALVHWHCFRTSADPAPAADCPRPPPLPPASFCAHQWRPLSTSVPCCSPLYLEDGHRTRVTFEMHSPVLTRPSSGFVAQSLLLLRVPDQTACRPLHLHCAGDLACLPSP